MQCFWNTIDVKDERKKKLQSNEQETLNHDPHPTTPLICIPCNFTNTNYPGGENKNLFNQWRHKH